MPSTRSISIAACSALAVAAIGLAGCGGSGEPATTSADGAGGAPAASDAGRISASAKAVVDTIPDTPVCNPGGLSNEDEETCQWFWNHLLAWQKLGTTPEAIAKGPILVGAPSSSTSGSMIYEGFDGEDLDDEHWWGPDLPSGCDGTGDRKQNPTYCKGKPPGLEFGKSTNIETLDVGSETKSTVSWKLTAGDAAMGVSRFTAYNNGGEGGFQWATCSGTEWVSCSRAAANHEGAYINTRQPDGNNEDYASFGWVIEDFPVLIGITNRLPSSRLTVRPPVGTTLLLSADGSSPGALTGKGASVEGADASTQALWLAGFRKRTGPATITLEGLLTAEGSGEGDSYDGATVRITADFRDLGDATCKVVGAETSGDVAKCDIRRTDGGVSKPGTLSATIRRGST